jgi:hypothetical protein
MPKLVSQRKPPEIPKSDLALKPSQTESVEGAVWVIGCDLNRGIYPRVHVGGAVTPSDSVSHLPLGEENHDAYRASSAATSSEGSQSSGATGSAAPLERASAQAVYVDGLTDVHAAYPGLRAWHQDGGLWLMTDSAVIPGLKKAATFLLAINEVEKRVKGWGFWRENSIGIRWIGPRHTNFGDGSICAFEPTDGTWGFGDSLVALLDLYSVWAFRHLHLEIFNRWPGLQFIHHRFEHHLELHIDELCGCGTDRRYRDCCYEQDRAEGPLTPAIDFLCKVGDWNRQPPRTVVGTVRDGEVPPNIHSISWR